jgi:hypothetical protein
MDVSVVLMVTIGIDYPDRVVEDNSKIRPKYCTLLPKVSAMLTTLMIHYCTIVWHSMIVVEGCFGDMSDRASREILRNLHLSLRIK